MDGPSLIDEKRYSMWREWEAYCVLYGEFETLAAHFTRKTIPIRRQVYDANTKEYSTEYAFPLYCDIKVDEDDAIDREEREREISADQQYLYSIWEQLQRKIDELCECDYVHLMSPWTQVSQTHRTLTGLTYENIDVTRERFIVSKRNILNGPTLHRSDLTKLHYRNALMEVIRSKP